MSNLLHLAAAVDLPDCFGAEPYVELVRLAERGGLDFVTLDDSFARPGPDALAVLSRAAPATRRIGLVPTVTTTHTEPFAVQSAVATLDWVSGGRAGWRIDVSAGEGEARLFGHRPTAPVGQLWEEAGEVADVAAKLWDSWEDGAEIRDMPGGRFLDRDKLHRVDFTGTAFSVRGPSTVPRPPQGHPVRLVDATERQARTVAARYADVALVRAATPAQAGAVRDELRAGAAEFGRNPDALRVLVSLLVDLGDGEHAAEPGHGGGGPRATGRGPLYRGGPVDLAELVTGWYTDGVADGFHLVPVEPRRDLERLVNGTVALLQHRGLFRTFYPGSTLREHLGLARPANQYAVSGRNVMAGGTS
ncbi:alkanesulfonate monooxygenase SsuD/methylene tetrahydromethanopterin reductase-like flavin-dependent oxidoreductase (luciferase family) [Streptomyces puniciscabiei]|uniref:Alkanesulfonate monooxygenase SsuD/methylene tetrahydromethanopterin reductase-like flavin-dependent oxidoreductase (Luciferase family) n=2 Tax=Streptomyces puniciscabiei TaxID=164348 RepID=A0A542ULY5_9ACTN|nr:LLM class flavin-dependent oxidoreductase [Streptomyces puniciscabiei]TQL00111.1 alkanesulfonate monooxygenase SsuD/methylene tetrahydromethanopterin reductase-like flavin-dependent oxidoreductase (luciferase family) [Streptomyces puniciscabiei]